MSLRGSVKYICWIYIIGYIVISTYSPITPLNDNPDLLIQFMEKELQNYNKDLEKKLKTKEKAKAYTQQSQPNTNSPPPTYPPQDPVLSLNMNIHPGNGSSDEEGPTELTHVNSNSLPPWMIRTVMDQ